MSTHNVCLISLMYAEQIPPYPIGLTQRSLRNNVNDVFVVIRTVAGYHGEMNAQIRVLVVVFSVVFFFLFFFGGGGGLICLIIPRLLVFMFINNSIFAKSFI